MSRLSFVNRFSQEHAEKFITGVDAQKLRANSFLPEYLFKQSGDLDRYLRSVTGDLYGIGYELAVGKVHLAGRSGAALEPVPVAVWVEVESNPDLRRNDIFLDVKHGFALLEDISPLVQQAAMIASAHFRGYSAKQTEVRTQMASILGVSVERFED